MKTGEPLKESTPENIVEIDAVGLRCPLPLLKVRKFLESLPQSGCVRIHTDDPVAAIDIPHFCQMAGHTILAQNQEKEILTYLIQKGTAGREQEQPSPLPQSREP